MAVMDLGALTPPVYPGDSASSAERKQYANQLLAHVRSLKQRYDAQGYGEVKMLLEHLPAAQGKRESSEKDDNEVEKVQDCFVALNEYYGDIDTVSSKAQVDDVIRTFKDDFEAIGNAAKDYNELIADAAKRAEAGSKDDKAFKQKVLDPLMDGRFSQQPLKKFAQIKALNEVLPEFVSSLFEGGEIEKNAWLEATQAAEKESIENLVYMPGDGTAQMTLDSQLLQDENFKSSDFYARLAGFDEKMGNHFESLAQPAEDESPDEPDPNAPKPDKPAEPKPPSASGDAPKPSKKKKEPTAYEKREMVRQNLNSMIARSIAASSSEHEKAAILLMVNILHKLLTGLYRTKEHKVEIGQNPNPTPKPVPTPPTPDPGKEAASPELSGKGTHAKDAPKPGKEAASPELSGQGKQAKDAPKPPFGGEMTGKGTYVPDPPTQARMDTIAEDSSAAMAAGLDMEDLMRVAAGELGVDLGGVPPAPPQVRGLEIEGGKQTPAEPDFGAKTEPPAPTSRGSRASLKSS